MKKIFCDLRLCLGCKSCEVACALEHSSVKNLFLAIKQGKRPKKMMKVESIQTKSLPLMCQHCEVTPCVNACMSGAMNKDKDTGKVTHNKERCVGCWMCIMVCPFGALLSDKKEKIVLKCDLCPDRNIPACVLACPTKALFMGTEEEFKRKMKNKAKCIM